MTWAQLASGRAPVAVRARSDDGKDTSATASASERAGRFDSLAERERIAVDSLPDGRRAGRPSESTLVGVLQGEVFCAHKALVHRAHITSQPLIFDPTFTSSTLPFYHITPSTSP
jgi:hypothetical protein